MRGISHCMPLHVGLLIASFQIIVVPFVQSEESLAGVPQSIHNGLLGTWGVSYSNDSTLYSSDERYRKHDDFRTAGFAGYAHIQQDIVLAFDYSILTDKHANQRSDELSLSVGWRELYRLEETRDLDVMLGVGFRIADDFGGESLQNSLHTFTSGVDVEMPYADNDSMLYAYGRVHFMEQYSDRLSYELRTALLLSVDGLLQYDLQARHAMQFSDDWQIGLGVRWRDHSGDALSVVGGSVLEEEAGAWILCAASYRGFGVQAEHNLEQSRTQLVLAYTYRVP